MSTKTILFVDDEPELLSLYQMTLEDEFNLILLTNPLDVLPVLKTQKVDLLVSDINMPQLCGRKLVGEVKTIFPELKALGISACYYNSDTDYMFDAYLQKPLENFSLLVNKINSLI